MTTAADLQQAAIGASNAGRHEEAAALLRQALAAQPEAAALHANLGLVLARAARWEEAISSYREALALDPGRASTLAKLGRALSAAGACSDAIDALDRAAYADPANPDTANALGAALAQSGPPGRDRARAAFTRAVTLDPAFGEAWRNLGRLEAEAENWAAAADALGRAAALEPAADTWYMLGVSLGRLDRPAVARDAYRRSLDLDPHQPEAWNNLGHVSGALGDHRAAHDAIARALSLRPDYADARYNLGVTLQNLDRPADARTAYQLVLAREGAHADALNNLGGICLAEARPAEAIPLYRRALEANPQHPEARWNLGLAQLAAGEWAGGWRNYESRPRARRFDNTPAWNPSMPLDSRAILLWCEQGLGDAIQFLRYAPELARRGAQVIVECPPRLAPLLRCASGLAAVVERGAALPAFDCHVAVMSLPFLLATRPDSVPAPGPVYDLPHDRRAHWRGRLDALAAPLRAGIVWGGNPGNHKGQNRSMPLTALLEGLAAVEGLALISLQHGPQAAELDTAAAAAVLRWEQEDLVDTAALVAELDLVITVDTLMAHLAGTVGRRVEVLLPYAADWRWMTARSDSPWYPGRMRLHRQPAPGDWAGAVRGLATSLRPESGSGY